MRRASVFVVGLWCSSFALTGSAFASVYDFSTGAGVDRFAYRNTVPVPPMPPVDNTAPSLPFTGSGYSAIAASDDLLYSTGVIENSQGTLVAGVRFVFTIAEPASTVSQIVVVWEGAASEDKPQFVWLWNAATSSYALVGTQVDVRPPPGGNGDATISATFATNAHEFVDANNNVTVLAYYSDADGGGALFTDYVSVTITGAPCNVDADCDDGLICNGLETCDPVSGCQTGTPVDCNDGVFCTTDVCSEPAGACDHVPEDAACANGLFCDGVELCDATSGCLPGTPVDCNDADACTIDSCNEATDSCDNVPTDPLPAAALPDPADGAVDVALTPTFTWNGGPPTPACAKSFDVYLDTGSPPATLVASGLANTSYSPVPLANATTYYWQIVTHDCCTEVAGPVWTFTTAGTPLLSTNPANLDFVLPPDQTGTLQIVVSNSGDAPTTWTLAELPTGTAAASAPDEPMVPDGRGGGRRSIDWTIPHEPSTLLVGFRTNPRANAMMATMQRDAVHSACKTTKLHSCATIPVDLVRVQAGANLRAVAAEYIANPSVAYVEPNYKFSVNAVPNDPSFGSLWGMHNTGQTGGTPDADIDAPEAWDIATGNQNIIVGVIDTGVDYNHSELAQNMWTNTAELNGAAGVDDDANGIVDDIYGARWTNGNGLPTSGDPYDDHYHGTHVAGTIGAAGNNSLGVVGINWNVRIMALKFLNSAGSGWLADAISAVEYATAQGAHLTSNSWGGGGYSQALKDAIDAAGAAGQLFVAAAGNNNQNSDIAPMYPAAYSSPTIVSVAATDHNDLRAWFSNWGPTTVDLAAPGVSVLSTSPGDAYRTLSGTSMATPHVSGVAALILSQNPAMAPLDVKQAILNNADPIASMAGMTVTGGRLNAAASVMAADPAPWLNATPTTGVVWPGGSAIINVTADTTGLAAGSVDSVLIRLSSGDPTGPLDVPVSLTVQCTLDSHCDDGSFCTGTETCDASGLCQPGTPVACDDGDPCTIDTCNDATTSCDNVPTDPLPAAASPDPADLAIELPLNPTLAWDGGPPTPLCSKTFDVYLDTSNPPITLVAAGLVDAIYSPAPLTAATTYHWQIVTHDCCTEVVGPVWSFTTAGTPVLGANPASLDFTLLPGRIGSFQVELTNSGDAPTAWNLVETAGGAAASAPEFPASVGGGQGPTLTNWDVPHEPTTLLVGFKVAQSPKQWSSIRRRGAGHGPTAGLSIVERAAVHAAFGTTTLRSWTTIPVDLVQVAPGADLVQVAARYAAHPAVSYVEPNYEFNVNGVPNDPSFGSLWGMHNTGQTGGMADADIDAPEAWNIATGNQNVIVAVIDTGVDYNHVELAQNMWTNTAELNGTAGVDDDANGIIDDIYGARWTNGTGTPTSGDPYDDHFHGTHVAGTIGAAGNNSLGVVGVNWNVRIMALKFLNSAGSGWLADAISAVDYAVAQGAHLTSNSWGGGGYSQALKDAIDAAGVAGQLFVAAAGNNGANSDVSPMYPAAYSSPTILSVAATDHNDLRAWFSNWGLTTVDLAAPGVNVLSTSPGNLYRTLSGTSMATPHVSGVAALVLSKAPGLTVLELKQIIMDSVDPIASMAGMTVTGGRLNAANALALTDPAPWLNPTPLTGVLWPGQTAIIVVTADATGLAAGFFGSASLIITSGDPAGPLNIPVSLSVTSCTTDAECDDGLFCNGVEVCDINGVCQSGTPTNCDDGIGCTTDACNESTASCDHLPVASMCDNGLFCDGVETCDSLLGCQPGTPVDCNDGVTCTADSCNEAAGVCDNTPDDTACDNGLFCDGVETCDAVLDCQAGTPVDCADTVGCTVDSCNEATSSCDHVPDDIACDNGLFCDGAETCHPTLDCQSGADPCPGQFCDDATDTCLGCTSDADCNDGVFCNGVESCDAFGVCQSGAPVDCDDGVACTVDSCNEATGACDNGPSDAACDNGLFCDGAETCDAVLGCQAGTPINCNDGVACTVDSCNDATDSCNNVPSDAACDNGLFCDGAETCDPLLDCQVGTPVDCTDGVGCTTDSCNETTDSCDNVAIDAACDNGLFCDGVETCDPMLDCQSGTPVNCDDAVGCTTDLCNEATGSCDNLPIDAACDNGLSCDGVETCDPLFDCQAGTPVNCDDGVGCTVDACNETTGSCDNLPSDAACDNGLFCDGPETCDSLLDCQTGTPPDCSGLTDQCNNGVCDEAAGACVAQPVLDGTICDDGDACPGDVCQAGVCEPANCGGPPPAPPTGLAAGMEVAVELQWTFDEGNPNLAGYNVYRSTTSGGPYTQVAALILDSQYVEFPPPGHYCYVVTAQNADGGESGYSNEVCGDVVNGG